MTQSGRWEAVFFSCEAYLLVGWICFYPLPRVANCGSLMLCDQEDHLMLQNITPLSAPTISMVVPPKSTTLPGLDSQGFLKLLVAQLQHQDPLSPTSPGDTVQQLAALSQVSTLQDISDVLKQLLIKGTKYDAASWLNRSALVPSSKALPLPDGSYAGEVLIDSPAVLDIIFTDSTGAVVHTEHHGESSQGIVAFSWNGQVDGVPVKGPLNVTVSASSGPPPSVAIWTTVASIRDPAASDTLIETPLGSFAQDVVIDLR